MIKLVYILISVFIIGLIINQIINCFSENIIEGAVGKRETISDDGKEYYNPELNNDPVYLGKLNAANIAYLKNQIDRISDLSAKIDTMDKQVQSNSYTINQLNTNLADTKKNTSGISNAELANTASGATNTNP